MKIYIGEDNAIMKEQNELLVEIEETLAMLDYIDIFKKIRFNEASFNSHILCYQNYYYLLILISDVYQILPYSLNNCSNKLNYQENLSRINDELWKQINGFCLNQVLMRVILDKVDISDWINVLIATKNLITPLCEDVDKN